MRKYIITIALMICIAVIACIHIDHVCSEQRVRPEGDFYVLYSEDGTALEIYSAKKVTVEEGAN